MENRVIGRQLARTLTEQELAAVAGGQEVDPGTGSRTPDCKCGNGEVDDCEGDLD